MNLKSGFQKIILSRKINRKRRKKTVRSINDLNTTHTSESGMTARIIHIDRLKNPERAKAHFRHVPYTNDFTERKDVIKNG